MTQLLRNRLRWVSWLPFLSVVLLAVPALGAEPWKGETRVRPWELGIMGGLSIYGRDSNWSALPSIARLLKDRAFVSDIDDRIWAELQMGPSFFYTDNSNETGLQYSAHLRWDFGYNEFWTVYALGGLSGYSLPPSRGDSFTLHPRFGVGAQYQTKTALILRGEVSAEFIGMGASFNF